MRQRQLQVSVVPLALCGHQGGTGGRLAVPRVQEAARQQDQKGAVMEVVCFGEYDGVGWHS